MFQIARDKILDSTQAQHEVKIATDFVGFGNGSKCSLQVTWNPDSIMFLQ